MTKKDMAAFVAEKTELSKKDAEAALNAVFDCIVHALQTEGKIQIIGFGNFEVKERAARTGKNPRTGESVEIPACKVPSFKAGKALKDAVK